MKKWLIILIPAVMVLSSLAYSQSVASLRGNVPISQEVAVEPMPKPIVNDRKVARNYPMQPPLIPHNIRDYQVNLNVNTCLSCHSRKRVGESQATMISVTHYMDRDGNFLADISPRRYFCNQCHVKQHDTAPLVENDFVDMDTLLQTRARLAEEQNQ